MIAPFGTWESPITSDSITEMSIGFKEMQATEEGLYWLEGRPSEKGRVALVRFDENEEDLLKEVSVRTRVHEYGGGAFFAGKEFIYSNGEDGQLYTLEGKKLTDAPNIRFADGCSRIWVAEKHGAEVENLLVFVGDDKIHELATGHDFYSSPRLSPDGKKLAFITWDFPNMQWDSSTLWLADIDSDHKLHNLKPICGGPNESVCQVQWSAAGVLHFVSDKTGFWNLYRHQDGKVENSCPMEAEFGIPAWVFGMPTYTFLPDGNILCAYTVKGIDHLGKIDHETKTLQDLGQPFTRIMNLVTFREKVYFFGATPINPNAIIAYDPVQNTYETLKQSAQVSLTEEWISKGEVLEYPSLDGKTGYAFYYPPKNPNYEPQEGEMPPVIIDVHGGPTGRSYTCFMQDVQFWTSRGFAIVDVNYGGSTGYGREYFKRLEKNWGVLDVEDCIAAAHALVDKGLADPTKLIIRGGSAGGYTTLAALAFHNVFAAGTSYFGVSDLELLYEDTHKFEAKYTDILVAPFPEEVEVIRERSPVHSADQISSPVLLLQGDQDKVVPPNQSQTIYDALRKNNIPVGMLLFEGEGHGFRRADSIKRSLDAELYFYSEILGIELPEPFDEPPVEIIRD
ncbi:MAG: prolyl oligopeptidase family serine peptidase [Simkaniaceae bacterium]|nr:prolyl oligopeptidase family serine peptidase [Candidatus Sacchlamyda saccharinae]